MRKPETIPQAVLDGARRWRDQHPNTRNDSSESPRWDALNGCYFFVSNGVYVGIELDGYVHS